MTGGSLGFESVFHPEAAATVSRHFGYNNPELQEEGTHLPGGNMRASHIGFAALWLAIVAATSAQAATFSVTNTDDSGVGSLRQAIVDANTSARADLIAFDISRSSVMQPHRLFARIMYTRICTGSWTWSLSRLSLWGSSEPPWR